MKQIEVSQNEAPEQGELDEEVISGLEAWEKLLLVLKKAGCGKTFAWPSDAETQEQVHNLLAEIEEVFGIELEIEPGGERKSGEEMFFSPSLILPFDGEPRIESAQAQQVWEGVLGLKRETSLKARLFGPRQKKREEQCFVRLSNLPGGSWQSVLATEHANKASLTISYNDDGQPRSWELELAGQTGAENTGAPVIPPEHALGNVALILGNKYSNGEIEIMASYCKSGSQRIVPPMPGRRGPRVNERLAQIQAEALLKLITP